MISGGMSKVLTMWDVQLCVGYGPCGECLHDATSPGAPRSGPEHSEEEKARTPSFLFLFFISSFRQILHLSS